MFHFLCNKTLVHSRNGYYIHHNPSMLLSFSLFTYFSTDAHNPHSFTVSYLTKTCGLSPELALSASKTVRFQSPDQPDSVVSCFQKFGFSNSNISQMIKKYPKMLHCNPDKIVSPKVEFFSSIGASTSDLVKFFTVNPRILELSLENRLIHTYNILTKMFQSEHTAAIQVIKRNPYALSKTPEVGLIPNVNALRENGVPESNILWLICNHWTCILTNPVKFEKIIDEVKQIGFSPLKLQFMVAIMVLAVVTKPKWDGRVEVYKKWGLSDTDITTAFKKFPRFMIYSEDNIVGTMDYYVNKMGFDSSFIVNRPVVLLYSLKKKIIPRSAVIQYLSSKGRVMLDSTIYDMLNLSESRFLEKYLKCHEDASHLIKLYNDKLNEAINEGK